MYRSATASQQATALRVVSSTLLVAALWGSPVRAQEEPELGWSGEAALSFVAVDGNAQSQTLGFKGKWIDTLPEAAVILEAGGYRSETTTIVRTAFGSVDDFNVAELEIDNLTAENYFLRGRYEGDIRPDLVWFAGAGWERNTFAGFDSRTLALVGIGKTWISNDATKFRTDLGLSYIWEEPSSPGIESESFAGLRLGWGFEHQFSPSTKLVNDLAVDPNLEDTDDFLADDLTTLTVSMTERLGLQLGLAPALRQPAGARTHRPLPAQRRDRIGARRAGRTRHHLHDFAGVEVLTRPEALHSCAVLS